ncbi:BT4734/BF3469 family protein [Pontibacter lucknowensis]|uniref:Primase C terminal 2 (PriCT-2) n=1 Tax=Pontibacter lucknowensis TaxID=1077936 RepID=A0A1N7A0J4_9BACT|nr:BT4734/BF3469 family protein [Pontibacter lucknowensis]SIR32533.1 Primase C terminal 2 (PriCT-2) [Pontibacter lucknowensis]
MESVLNVQVSCFKRCFIPSGMATVNLCTWLTSDKYAKEVLAIRNEEYDTERSILKRRLLPVITPSGIFPYRNEGNCKSHSGLIQFDIDEKENPAMKDLDAAREMLATLPYVAYCGLSVSGRGLWGLVSIYDSAHHTEHFEYLYREISSMGMKLDTAPRNIASARFYSYDPNAYFNHWAKPLRGRYKAPKQEYHATTTGNPTEDQAKVEACISEIIRQGIDVTTSYHQDWLPIGCNFASTFGESGREYFHQVSQFHPKYSQRETDRQYDRCLSKCNGIAAIGTFFSRCADKGINYKELLKRGEV